MISAHASWYVPAGKLRGRVPGTTTALAGTSPRYSTGSGRVTASVSEFQFVQGAKFRTLQVQTRGEKTLQDPSSRGAGGTCSWYHSETYRSKFPQRAGYVTGVTLQLFSDPGHVITRTFRLHP